MSKRETIASLNRIYNGLQTLANLGATSTLRRALAVVAEELEDVSPEHVYPRCNGGGGPHNPGWPRVKDPFVPESDGPFDFTDAQFEIQQEDRRSSILLDPEEALASKLVDHYLGRFDVVETRGRRGFISEIFDASHEKAIQYIRDCHPLVSVNSIAANSKREVIDALRTLAHSLEQDETNLDVELKKLPDIKVLVMEKCTLVRVEVGPTRWTNNGRTLDQYSRDVFSCLADDACCTNQARTKYGDWNWKTVWSDGNLGSPPPALPPDYVRQPWDNRCPVFGRSGIGEVTSDWGWRSLNGQPNFHGGMDIAAPAGTEVLAAVAGDVVWINDTGAGGETGVVVRTGAETRTYWHIDPRSGLQEGPVSRGAVLGTISSQSSAIHLHFALHTPPNGDPTLRSDANSHEPCP